MRAPSFSSLISVVGVTDVQVVNSSLQEISPLTQGYLGGQFLNPYLNPFKEALNIAALGIEQQSAGSSGDNGETRSIRPLQRTKTSISGMFRRQPDYPYKLVEARNVGMTAIMLFARKPDAIHHIQHAECAFGIANMGNKGGVALRVTYAGAGTADFEDDVCDDDDDDTAAGTRTAEITFVATHLAAMEYNLRRRNANWARWVLDCFVMFVVRTDLWLQHLLLVLVRGPETNASARVSLGTPRH